MPVRWSVRVFEASAPGRCGIVGNPSDIYGGVVVSCSVPARARCRLTLDAPETRLPDDTRLWDAATKRFPIEGIVDVGWTTSIPRSSGLSGSTALLAATLACVFAARDEAHRLENRSHYAELLRDVERHDADIMCGYQDAYMISHGGLMRMDFAGKHPVNPGPTAEAVQFKSELPFILITTGVERLSGAVHGPMAQRWLRHEPAVLKAMTEIAHCGREGAGALAKGDWICLAELMNENHRLIASVGGSGDAIDELIACCLDGGAMAAKLAGAGLGGTVIALSFDLDGLEQRLGAAGYSRFMRPQIVPGVMLEKS